MWNVSVTRSHMHETVQNLVVFPGLFQIELVAGKCQEPQPFSSISLQNFIEIDILASITSVASYISNDHHFSFVGS